MSRGGIYLFLGPERSGKLKRIHELERAFEVNPLDFHQLDYAVCDSAKLLALCRQKPALSPLRLIVVDHAHRLDEACVEALLLNATSIADNACVILLVETELGVRHPLSQALKELKTERFLAGPRAVLKPFAFTDAIGARDINAALSSAHDQFCAGREPLELLGLVAWQLNRWIVVKRLRRLGYGVERIADATGMHPWQVQRMCGETASRTLDSLQDMLELCWQLDAGAKTGRFIPEIALEQLVAQICLS